MLYSAYQTEIQTLAFDSSWSTQINNWIRAKEGEVWQAAEWPIKQTASINITVTNGTATVALPTGMTIPPQALRIFDENGYELDHLDPRQFFETYQPYTASGTTGPGEAWTIASTISGSAVTSSLRLGPTPSQSRTYTVMGWTLPVCRDTATTWKLGTMSSGTDRQWWPDDYDYFLVPGAAALGKKLTDGFGWEALDQEFQAGLSRLAEELAPTRDPDLQMGAWPGY